MALATPFAFVHENDRGRGAMMVLVGDSWVCDICGRVEETDCVEAGTRQSSVRNLRYHWMYG